MVPTPRSHLPVIFLLDAPLLPWCLGPACSTGLWDLQLRKPSYKMRTEANQGPRTLKAATGLRAGAAGNPVCACVRWRKVRRRHLLG